MTKKKIKITETDTPEHIEIIIEDDGPGIPDDRKKDAMRPFVRLDDARGTDTGGTGLGLSIAQTMIENHGYFCQDSDRVERIITGVSHKNFGALIDIGNFLCAVIFKVVKGNRLPFVGAQLFECLVQAYKFIHRCNRFGNRIKGKLQILGFIETENLLSE